MKESTSLCSGDFILDTADGDTYLTALAPVNGDQQISHSGNFTNWSINEWNALIKKSKRFSRSDLIQDLKYLRNDTLEGRDTKELPLVKDDEGEKLKRVYTLEIHYSRKEEYIKILGTSTQEHRRELSDLGFLWNSKSLEWKASFSEKLLELAAGYVCKNGKSYNPGEIDYERCTSCGRWKPQEKRCRCGS